MHSFFEGGEAARKIYAPWFPVRTPSTGVTIQRQIGQGLPWSHGHTLMLVPLVLVEGLHSFFEGGEAARKSCTCIYIHMYTYVHIYMCMCICVHIGIHVYIYIYIYIYNLQLDGNTSPWFPVRAPSTGVTIQRKIGQGLPWSRGHTLMLVPLVLVEGVHSFFEG